MERQDAITIRNELRPGDIGYLIYLHGWIYARECGYNHLFEGYVCRTFDEFLSAYDPVKDGVWFAEADGRIIGAMAAVGRTPQRAQLRWFILHPDYRGLGLGKQLLQASLEFCRQKGYTEIYLETTADQEVAIKMYERAGFKKVAEHISHIWGKTLTEQTFEMRLA